jgi:hypothetical protein
MNKIQFTHDCEDCIFIGRYDWGQYENEPTYDLYVCKSRFGWSSIARHGNEGWEYISSPCGHTSPIGYPTREAYDRAVAKGIIPAATKDVNPLTYEEQLAKQDLNLKF